MIHWTKGAQGQAFRPLLQEAKWAGICIHCKVLPILASPGNSGQAMNKRAIADSKDLVRQLPAVDVVLHLAGDLVNTFGHAFVAQKSREVLDVFRQKILKGEMAGIDTDNLDKEVIQALLQSLTDAETTSLVPVFNLTGTVLHTNLGRAILPESAIDAVAAVSRLPVNLEFDLDSGKRGERDSHVETLLCELTGAEAATVVNNNAAAVLLVLNTLAQGKEVPVSRGELVEIGGSFRIPEVMERSGCTLVEVGATNRTHLKDYNKAINDSTALLMKVHASNYRIEGFTAEVTERELAVLAQEHAIPFVMDMGSGCLVDLEDYGLPGEPTAAQMISLGADLVTFSGDKLLGGPQCGIIAGRRDLVEQVRSNPLKRALRLDKMTLAALAEVLKLYRNPEALAQTLPTMRLFTRPLGEIEKTAQKVAKAFGKRLEESFTVETQKGQSQIGSGAMPVEGIPTFTVVINGPQHNDAALRQLAESLRQLPRPVIGRINNGQLILDMRCLENGSQEKEFIAQLDLLGG